MRKSLILSLALLTLTAGLWAETIDNVKYIDANGVEQTANGGDVTTTGGQTSGDGIGNGNSGSSSANIIMPINYRIKIDGTFIHNDGTDLANHLAGKHHVEVYPDECLDIRNAAVAAITAAVKGITDENILAIATTAIENIFLAENSSNIIGVKEDASAALQNAISFYNSGKAVSKAEAKTELLGTMATPCTDCTAVQVTKGDKTITFYAPTSVKYIKK